MEKEENKGQAIPTPLHSDVNPFKWTALNERKTGVYLNEVDGKFIFQEVTGTDPKTAAHGEVFAIDQSDLSSKLIQAIKDKCKSGETVVYIQYLGNDAAGNKMFVAETVE